MQPVSNQIVCGTCGIVYTVPSGSSVPCQVCGKILTMPAAGGQQVPTARIVQSGLPGSAPMAIPHGANQAPLAVPAATNAAPMAVPVAAHGAGAQMPQAMPLGPPTAPIPPHLVNPASAVLPAPSPPSADGNKPGEAPLPYVRSPSAMRGLLWMMGAVVIVLLVVGGAVAIYLTRPDSSKKEVAAPDEVIVELPPVDRGPTKWHEATSPNTALQLDGIRVRVERLEYGEVLARDARRHVQSSEGKKFLQIYLQIQNQRNQDLNYRSWYGNTFPSNGTEVAARLTDDRGRKYQMMTFGDVAAVMGHVPDAVVKPRSQGRQVSSVEDVLIYDVPSGVDLNSAKYVRLELPAEAIGATGAYNFQIPTSRLKSSVPPPVE